MFLQFGSVCNISAPLSGAEFGQEEIVGRQLHINFGFRSRMIRTSAAVELAGSSYLMVAIDDYVAKVSLHWRTSDEGSSEKGCHPLNGTLQSIFPIGLIYFEPLRIEQPPYKGQHGWPQTVSRKGTTSINCIANNPHIPSVKKLVTLQCTVKPYYTCNLAVFGHWSGK